MAMDQAAAPNGGDVVLPVVLSGVLLAIGTGIAGQRIADLQNKVNAGSPIPVAGTDIKTAFIGWGVVGVTLVVLGETQLAQLAVAFAWLIVMTELFTFGPEIATGVNAALSTGRLLPNLGPSSSQGSAPKKTSTEN